MRTHARVKWARVRVFAVGIGAAAILAVLLYLLTGGMLFADKTSLYVYAPDATGIGQNSPVRVNGIPVGKVDSVALSGSRDPKRVVRVKLTIETNLLAMIPVGSYAGFATESFIGDKYVDVTSRGRAPTPPNSELPFQEPTDFLKTLDFAQFDRNLRQMDAILTDIENGRGLVGQLVMGSQLYTDLRRKLIDVERGFQAAASTTGAFGREVYTERLYRQLLAPLTDFDQALARLQSGQGAAGRLLTDSAQYDQLVASVSGMRQSIADVRASKVMQSDELYVSWNGVVNSLARSVDEINARPDFATAATYDNLNGFARELESTLRDFRENPRKYLRIKVF